MCLIGCRCSFLPGDWQPCLPRPQPRSLRVPGPLSQRMPAWSSGASSLPLTSPVFRDTGPHEVTVIRRRQGVKLFTKAPTSTPSGKPHGSRKWAAWGRAREHTASHTRPSAPSLTPVPPSTEEPGKQRRQRLLGLGWSSPLGVPAWCLRWGELPRFTGGREEARRATSLLQDPW